MGATLVVNPGSSSRKYALYSKDRKIIEYRFESTTAGHEMCSQIYGQQQICTTIDSNDFINSFVWVAEEVDKYLFKESNLKLEKVVFRIVAPGTYFQHHAEIDDEYLKKLRECESVASLHVPTIIKEIIAAKDYFKQVKIIAASDSAFHSEMPFRAREYSIVPGDTETYDIHRFGYHGLSVASVIRRLHPIIGIEPEKVVVCHIGNGISVTAVKNGKSVDTSMGFSPTSGLPMGTRAGDVDAGALIQLMRAKHWRPRDAELYLNTSGGLAGMASDGDIRRLLDRRAQNDILATRALDSLTYHIQKSVASSTVALGGLEVLVLTATVAVRSAELRTMILNGLKYLGIEINEERNQMMVGKEGVISVRNSPVKVVVMQTDEMGEMFNVANQLKL